MVEKEKFVEMKAKADQALVKKIKNRQLERMKKNHAWQMKTNEAGTNHAYRTLEEPGLKHLSTFRNRPGEKVGRGRTRGKKSNAEYLAELKAKQGNDKGGGNSR